MAQLRIEQVRAPDFSASAELLRSANESFNTGMDTARGILESYNEGQQTRGDQALIGALAGLSSEDELASFLASTDLASMNISDTMRQNILGAREMILGNNATRDATSRANAGERRVASEYADEVAARDELRGLTPAYVTALADGHRYGTGSGGQGEDVQSQVYQGLLDRGMPAHIAQGFMMNFEDESGFDIDVTEAEPNVHGTFGRGLYQLTGPRRDAFEAQFGDDYSIDNQLDFLMQELQTTEADAAEAIFATQDAGSAGAAIVSQFLRPARQHEVARTARYTGGQGWNASGVSTRPIVENPMGGQAVDAFTAALRASTHMTPDAAAELFNSVLTQQTRGQELIAAAEARRQADLGATATRDAILNPNNVSEADIQRQLLTTEGLSAANQLDVAGQDLRQFGGVIAPSLGEDSEVTDALARIAEDDARTVEMDPLLRPFELAETFDNADDTGAALLEGFDIPEEFDVDPAYVNRRIQELADAASLTNGEMAAVLSQMSDNNYTLLRVLLSNANPGNETFTRVMGMAEQSYGEAARAAYDSRRGEMSRTAASREAAELQYTAARTRAARLPIGSEARAAAEAEVADLRDTILWGMTPREREANLRDYISRTGMVSRFQGLNPNSGEFTRAMLELEEYIRIDNTLTEAEKELLLRDIRG